MEPVLGTTPFWWPSGRSQMVHGCHGTLRGCRPLIRTAPALLEDEENCAATSIFILKALLFSVPLPFSSRGVDGRQALSNAE